MPAVPSRRQFLGLCARRPDAGGPAPPAGPRRRADGPRQGRHHGLPQRRAEPHRHVRPEADAPAEYRGEFKPIRTNVPGMRHLRTPAAAGEDRRQARHRPQHEVPAAGAHRAGALHRLPARQPAGHRLGRQQAAQPTPACAARCRPTSTSATPTTSATPASSARRTRRTSPARRPANLGLARDMTARPARRPPRACCRSFDDARRDLDDPRGSRAGHGRLHGPGPGDDDHQPGPRRLRLSQEPDRGPRDGTARGPSTCWPAGWSRPGVPVVTITPQNHGVPPKCNGQWDHHDHIFECLRAILPQLDRSVHALVTDLHDRGLAEDVAVVDLGRDGPHAARRHAARHGRPAATTGRRRASRSWPAAGLQTGQVVGATNARGERPAGEPYTPQNVLATLYHVLGIDPETTLPDHTGRPVQLLDDAAADQGTGVGPAVGYNDGYERCAEATRDGVRPSPRRGIDAGPRPVGRRARLAHLPHLLFLDSADRHPDRGRYSFVTADPADWLVDSTRHPTYPDPFAELNRRLGTFPVTTLPGLPPFQGGVAGAVRVRAAARRRAHSPRRVRRVPRPGPGGRRLRLGDRLGPPARPGVGDLDRVPGRARAGGNAAGGGEGRGSWWGQVSELSEERFRQIRRSAATVEEATLAPQYPLPASPESPATSTATATRPPSRRAVEYIHAGDCFQVNLSQRLLAPLTRAPARPVRPAPRAQPGPVRRLLRPRRLPDRSARRRNGSCGCTDGDGRDAADQGHAAARPRPRPRTRARVAELRRQPRRTGPRT